MFEMLLMIITLLAGKLGLNSQNSSKPPSTEPDQSKKRGRERKPKERNLLERFRDFENDVLGSDPERLT